MRNAVSALSPRTMREISRIRRASGLPSAIPFSPSRMAPTMDWYMASGVIVVICIGFKPSIAVPVAKPWSTLPNIIPPGDILQASCRVRSFLEIVLVALDHCSSRHGIDVAGSLAGGLGEVPHLNHDFIKSGREFVGKFPIGWPRDCSD